jgi:hypothetical protein
VGVAAIVADRALDSDAVHGFVLDVESGELAEVEVG